MVILMVKKLPASQEPKSSSWQKLSWPSSVEFVALQPVKFRICFMLFLTSWYRPLFFFVSCLFIYLPALDKFLNAAARNLLLLWSVSAKKGFFFFFGSDITPQFCTVAMFGIDDVGVSQLPCSFTLYKLSFNQSCNFFRAFPHHQIDCYSIDIIYEENWTSINMEWPSVARNLYKVLWKSVSCFKVLLLGYRERHNNTMSLFDCVFACVWLHCFLPRT
jgi:hypothetical protein